MERIEYRTQDKSDWGDGPWQSEPDKVQWQDTDTGLPCLIVRNHAGSLCGYVGVSESHPEFGHHYWDVPADVHGGLTFSDSCDGGCEEESICHIPAEGEPDHVWWLGFDCAHSGDYSPLDRYFTDGDVYRDIGYVEDQVRRLAQQLKEMEDVV